MSETAGKVIKCRAAVAWAEKEPFCIEEVEVAPPKAHEVRIKIVATGVCQSDISFLNGLIPIATNFPTILGHEGAGIVESVGEGVDNFKEGDHVIPLYHSQCFECAGCRHPKSTQCFKLFPRQYQGLMQDGTSRFTCKGQRLHHSMGVSTFSEYTVVNDVSLVKINEEAPLEKVCLIGCAIATGYGAALNTAKVEPGSRCAVWGLGGIGLAAVMGCRIAGASKIYGIDTNPDKFEIARKFGCTDVLNPKDFEGKKFADVLTQMTGGGFDYTLECIGNVNTIVDALESTNRNYGKTVLVGIPGYDKKIELTPASIVSGRTLTGSVFGGWRSVEAVPKLVEEYMSGKIMVDEFITHKLKLDDINHSLELMKNGKCVRCVIHY